ASLAGACATVAGPREATDIAIQSFRVWPENPPGGEAVTATEGIIERSVDPAVHDRAVLHVRTPTLKVFHPARPNGAAVLICPGGAYQRVVLDKEGDELAIRLAQAGIVAAVLVYRLPLDGWAAGWQAPLQDAQRAMKMLRSGFAAQGVDPKRVGVLGFSAGGHLAAALTLVGAAPAYPPADAIDAASSAPDFSALIYAAYLGGQGSPALAESPAGPAPDLVAQVDARTPPVFLVHAADDRSVPVEGSLRMHSALQAAGVSSELHVFPDGGHGFGIAGAKGKEAEHWPEMFLAWGRKQNFFR
ncbi:MAG TPA: alpha/beta hydrolase, partial [Hyphomonadaceae bacterium]|nr:alpha/beta hydrolase [Hyphomonadaceae bacterium]